MRGYIAKILETDYNKTMNFPLVGMVDLRAFVFLWLAVLLVAVILSVVLLYHWWRYLPKKFTFVGLVVVYFGGLFIWLLLSLFALYGVIK